MTVRARTTLLIATLVSASCIGPGALPGSLSALGTDTSAETDQTTSADATAVPEVVEPTCLTKTVCVTDSDCESGAHCNEGISPPTCGLLYCAGAGEVCGTDDGLCQQGLVCFQGASPARCTVITGKEGSACDAVNTCDMALACRDNECVVPIVRLPDTPNRAYGLFGDLTGTLAGIYLDAFLDVSVDPLTAEVWAVLTIAVNHDEPGTTDPSELSPYEDEKGWAIFITGTVTSDEVGYTLNFDDDSEVHIAVLGFMKVVLSDLHIRFTSDGFDGSAFTGILSSSGATLNGTSLGPVEAPLVAFETVLPAGVPRACANTPCNTMEQQGGDCQLPTLWTPGPGSACD